MKRNNLYITVLLFVAVANTAFAATKALEWKFENDLNDSSGNGINGTAYGTAAYDTGVSGQAFSSNGNNCVYKTGIDTAVLPVLASDPWSVNVWVYPDGVEGGWRLAWCLGNKPIGSTDCNSRSVYRSDSGGIAFTDGRGTGVSYIGTGIPWDAYQWQMVTATYDGNNVRIYKNGLLIGKKAFTFLNAPGEVRIPSNPWAQNNFFMGKFDEFTVWRGALTQQEIIALIPPGILPGAGYLDEVAYYTMEDPCETMTIPDHSGNSNYGALFAYSSPVMNWVTGGKKGGSLLFNGYEAVDLPIGLSISQYLQHSVAFWFKSGFQPYDGAFYSEKSPTSGNGNQFIIRGNATSTSGIIQVFASNQWYDMQYNMYFDASAYMDSKTWHHLAVTCDGDLINLYLDANVVATSAISNFKDKTVMNGSIGFNWNDLGFLGTWDKTYLDDFHLYKGTLTQNDVNILFAMGNVDNDLSLDLWDLDEIANQWLNNTTSVAGSTLLIDDMEGSLANWSVYSGSYTGTGTISSTTNAYSGAKALQWDYNLPARTGGNYTGIRYDFGTSRDLTGYDAMKLFLYRHTGNTTEDLMYVQFYDATPTLQAEVWLVDSNCVVLPANQWDQWYINLNAKLHNGTGYVDKSVLTSIRYVLIGCGGTRTDARAGAIDFDEIKMMKYPVCLPYLAGDIGSLEYKDCKVEFTDFAAFARDWWLGSN